MLTKEMDKNRSKAQKKKWAELKKRPMITDDELLEVIYIVIDRGYTEEAMVIPIKEFLKVWGPNMRLAFIRKEIRNELKKRGYQHWQNDGYFDAKIMEFKKQKKLRLIPTRKKGYSGTHYYSFIKKPMEA